MRALLPRRRGPDARTIGEKLVDFRASIDLVAVAGLRRPDAFEDAIEVVVPCFDHAPYLPDALESIRAQSWEGRAAVRVAFVDDRSTDRSFEVMNELRDAHPELAIRVLRNARNQKQARSINRAVESSTAALLLILNADDILVPDCLELVVETYRARPELMMLGGGSHGFRSGEPLPEHVRRPREELALTVYGPEDAPGFVELNDLNLSHSSSSFFRVAWAAVGGYFPPERRVCSYDDRDFQMRVCSLFPVGAYEGYELEFWRLDSSQGRGMQ